MNVTTEQIAEFCHESNRAYCRIIGDTVRKPWNELSGAERMSLISGVNYYRENPMSKPDEQHDAWRKAKTALGWEYGAIRDDANKKHPCLVPYDELPREQKLKDELFRNNVDLLW